MIYLQLFLDVLTSFYEALKNINHYYNSTENFSFAIGFTYHFDFIFQWHPMLVSYTTLTTFFKYLSIALTFLLFKLVPLSVFV
jgi:hypothetical protein